MKTLDEMFAEINKAGWMVNNLFQPVDGTWRCNIRRKTQPRTPGDPSQWAHEFCDGTTPQEAVAGAIVDMRQPRNSEKFDKDWAAQYKKAPKAAKGKTSEQLIEESGL